MGVHELCRDRCRDSVVDAAAGAAAVTSENVRAGVAEEADIRDAVESKYSYEIIQRDFLKKKNYTTCIRDDSIGH